MYTDERRETLAVLVGRNIKDAREAANMTQEVLALRMGKPRYRLSEWERGVHLPTGDSLAKLCTALEIPLSILFTERDKAA